MEINPYESRLRMLQQFDGVQMQREAAPDAETAGCPGCPYFWTCPVPHQGEEVRAPQEIELEDVRGELGPRRAYRPRDESDIGWADDWVDEDEDEEIDPGAADAVEETDDAEPDDAGTDDAEPDAAEAGRSVTDDEVTRRRSWWNPFNRRR